MAALSDFPVGYLKSNSLLRPVCPDRISRADLGTFRHLARYFIHSRLAALSTGGAVSRILSASPCSPVTVFFEDLGCTNILKLMPSGRSFICSMIFSVTGDNLYKIMSAEYGSL